MQMSMDTIQFESSREIEQISYALAEFLKDHKRTDIRENVERLIDLLDVMYMCW